MPIGSITIIATASAPTGWLLCDGAEYSSVDYPELFGLIDPAYQTGPDTFVTPDLRGAFVLGGGHGDYATNSTGGSPTVTLTSGQMPYHQHTFPPHQHGYVQPTELELSLAAGSNAVTLAQVGSGLTDESGYIQDGGQGGSEPHGNMPPYRVLNYAIRAK